MPSWKEGLLGTFRQGPATGSLPQVEISLLVSAPDPCSHFGKKQKQKLKKGLSAHSAWDPRVLGGEEAAAPQRCSVHPWREGRLSSDASLVQGLGPWHVAAEHEFDPKEAAQGSSEICFQALCQPPKPPSSSDCTAVKNKIRPLWWRLPLGT